MNLIKYFYKYQDHPGVSSINMLTHSCLEISLASVVCISYILENDYHIKHKLGKKLNDMYDLVSDEHFFFKYFLRNVFVREISPKQSERFRVVLV